ncbi:HAD family hydrolase [Nostoc calcicola FACHB-3891]|nr:HAD family hydrolase [Nostoc calcicola FACHB-3891]
MSGYTGEVRLSCGTLRERGLWSGDNPNRDIKGAQKIGIRGIWIDRSRKTLSQNICIPDAQISSLSELLNII